MNNQAVWQKYSGKVAWPTIFLFVGLLIGYVMLTYFYVNGLSGVWTSVTGALLAYGMFTIAHEASHNNISGGVKSYVFLESMLGWISSALLLFPFSAFKVIHLRHHAHTNDPAKDPDHYVNGKNAFSIFFRCLTLIGHYFGLTLGEDSKADPAMRSIRKQSMVFITFLSVTLIGLIATGEGLTLLYVFILSALIAAPILAFSFDWIPHYPHNNLDKYHNTRVITIPGLEFISLYQSYHLMHHLYPRVPFYNYKDCFLDYEKKLLEEQSTIEGFRTQDSRLMKRKNTYVDLIKGSTWNYILEVENVFQETHDAIKITFKNLDQIPFKFKPGQYVVISDYVDGVLVSRCYSICENPNTGKLSVAVKSVPRGKLSDHLLTNVREHSKLKVSGPFGNFTLPKTVKQPIVLIAGGSGITPILSILKTFLDSNNHHITLLYGCRSAEDVIFKEELEQLAEVFESRFSYILSFDMLDSNRQYELLKFIALDSLCYICGPQPMMDASKEALAKLGIANDHINTEEFAIETPALSGITKEVFFTMYQEEISFSVDTKETILEGAIASQKEIPYACGMGQCGTCKTKLIEGEVHWKRTEDIALLEHEKEQGYILPCICSPKTTIKLNV